MNNYNVEIVITGRDIIKIENVSYKFASRLDTIFSLEYPTTLEHTTITLIKDIKCLTCIHCNEGEIVDETIAMFKCDVYGLKVIGVFGCNDYEKRVRDKIAQSKGGKK